jgi:hypothetical protein
VPAASCHREHKFLLAGCTTLLLLALCSRFAGAAALPVPQFGSQKKAAAQDYALIFGTVWSPDNRPVGGIPIKIRRATDKKAKWELVSDSHGEFAQRVPPGKMDYIIQADIKTPKGQPKPEITVQIEDNERKTVGLHLNDLEPAKK